MSHESQPEIKAVLLDWDDTCVKTIEPIWMLHKFIAKTYYQKALTDEEIGAHWGKPLHELIGILYETDDHDTALDNIRRHKDEAAYFKEFFHKVPELLSRIASHRKLGLVTAHVREFLDVEFEYLGLNPSVWNYIQTSEQTAVHKPHPAVFDPAVRWLEEHAVDRHEILYVGDSFKDHDAAVNAGLQFLGVTTGLVTAEAFAGAGARSIDNLFELEDYLD